LLQTGPSDAAVVREPAASETDPRLRKKLAELMQK